MRHTMSPRHMNADQDTQAQSRTGSTDRTQRTIDQLVSDPMSAEAVNTASMALKKALIERALRAELSHHRDYTAGADKTTSTAHPARPS